MQKEPLNIEFSDYEGKKVILISGDIDMYSSPWLRKSIMTLVGQKTSPLLVDFGNVSYIDSSGIATFVEGLKGMMSFGGKLIFFNIPNGVMEIFTFSKLDKVFTICGTIHDAANS
jgi:anti-sigma B factor antagonist